MMSFEEWFENLDRLFFDKHANAGTEYLNKHRAAIKTIAESAWNESRKQLKEQSEVAAQHIEYACRQYSIGVDVVEQGMFDMVPLTKLLEYAKQLREQDDEKRRRNLRQRWQLDWLQNLWVRWST